MIEVRNLKFGYKPKALLFNDLNLKLEPGKVYGLLGKNGVGKTTLLKIFSALIYPKDGEVKINNINSTGRKAAYLSQLFILPEEIDLPHSKMKTFVKYNSVFYQNFDFQLFDDMVKAFELDEYKFLDKMSYGQKKKFLIAFAFATNTQVLLLDEPTNGLDIPSKQVFRKFLPQIASDDKIIIISTHQVRDIDGLLDEIVILDKGKIIFKASLFDVSETLMLKKTDQPAEDALYSEKDFAGYTLLLPNDGTFSDNIPLEMLFTAVIENYARINELFNQKNTEK